MVIVQVPKISSFDAFKIGVRIVATGEKMRPPAFKRKSGIKRIRDMMMDELRGKFMSMVVAPSLKPPGGGAPRYEDAKIWSLLKAGMKSGEGVEGVSVKKHQILLIIFCHLKSVMVFVFKIWSHS